MKTVRYVPALARGEAPTFEGFVELKPMTLDEKYDIMDQLGMDVKVENGESTIVRGKRGNMAWVAATIRHAKPKYVSVDLKHKESGKEFKSYEDLEGDIELTQGILTDVASTWFSGMKVGNG